VGVNSTPGQGSTFWLRLPIAGDSARDVSQAA
jgi:signal transduction histidine kinase